MLAMWLPARKSGADDETVRTVMSSNICRYTGYRGILRAVARVRYAPCDAGVNGAPQQ
jgi:aerobic-type carbon monoxide dehydrogenase small subunit (CoxS/CutS family)